eukprot:TRINITY_DN2466_c0_g1_i1.p1 TRINITY_DN2466_c0_g1~~TRINITY_DN2466_c0_g1_i1.p1  ORF type:complete len:273 (+),score=75.64 TRINITY_DN2466_c0_g1_i1:315-1133(+)
MKDGRGGEALTPKPPAASPAKTASSTGRRWKARTDPPPPAFTSVLSTVKKAPSCSLSSRHKKVAMATNVPGPGAYEAPAVNSYVSPRFVRPLPSISEKFVHSNPGPGAYNPSKWSSKGAGFTLKSRVKAPDSKDSVPPPGTYDPPSGVNYTSGFSFGRPQRPGAPRRAASKADVKGVPAPGPGAYDIVADPRKKTHGVKPGFTMSYRWKQPSAMADVPGPGAYDNSARDLAKTKGKITLKGRFPAIESKFGQGPAPDYDVRPPALNAPERAP